MQLHSLKTTASRKLEGRDMECRIETKNMLKIKEKNVELKTQCTVCMQWFEDLLVHITQVHKNPEWKQVCSRCGKLFFGVFSGSALKRHIEKVHRTKRVLSSKTVKFCASKYGIHMNNVHLHGKSEESEEYPLSADKNTMSYDLLPCSPYSPDWKMLGSAMVRTMLTKMLGTARFRGSGKEGKLGVGYPPAGWPDDILPWSRYKGSTRSRLSFPQVTSIIISMLKAAGVDPETHVMPGSHKA